MKTLMFLILLALQVLANQANAQAGPHNFDITCDSMNIWDDPRNQGTPLAPDESWSIHVHNIDATGDQSAFTMTQYKNGVIVLGPLLVPVNFSYYQVSSSTGAISISIPGSCRGGECGRLTVNRLGLPFSTDPFIMYGWSSAPLTVTAAMEYRCQIQGLRSKQRRYRNCDSHQNLGRHFLFSFVRLRDP